MPLISTALVTPGDAQFSEERLVLGDPMPDDVVMLPTVKAVEAELRKSARE